MEVIILPSYLLLCVLSKGLPVFPCARIIVSDAIFAHRPNSAFYDSPGASERYCVDVGSGSEGSTGLKINSLTPGLWTAAMLVVSLEETRLSSYKTVKDLQEI
ncbi:hypothetical protein NQZ68_017011 [Dissostichus eleginoides]|nr:hypothetical protein NQZ68_017011 [Dissostichus eleginoides]